MSRVTKRKHVARELLQERVEPAEGQRIVRVLGSPGNNLHEVETAEGSRFLTSMPPRFRHHVWIKRGDFLLVDPIEEGSKVKAEMALVLLPPHIRCLQQQGLWPEAFTTAEMIREGPPSPTDLLVNPNRAGPDADDPSDDSSDDPSDPDNESSDPDDDPSDHSGHQFQHWDQYRDQEAAG